MTHPGAGEGQEHSYDEALQSQGDSCTLQTKNLLWSIVLSPSSHRCIVLGISSYSALFYPTEHMSETRLMARDIIKTLPQDQVPQPSVTSGDPRMKEPVVGENLSPVRGLDLMECVEGR